MLDRTTGGAGSERVARVGALLTRLGIGAIACSRNTDVLMLSGYWPVTGASIAICSADGQLALLVPEDEREVVALGWADRVHSYAPASLSTLGDRRARVAAALGPLLAAMRLGEGTVACEWEAGRVTASYIGQHIYGDSLRQLLGEALPRSAIVPGDALLASLRMVPTREERARIRSACTAAASAYEAGALAMRPGITEMAAVLPFQYGYVATALQWPRARSAAAFYCMSGPNSAQAHAAFQRTRARPLQGGEPIIVHCNSCINGYWTDITRTYVLGTPDAPLRAMLEVIGEARAAALGAIRPGVRAADVDRAARQVLARAGYGDAFKHATGHGVCFCAIDHDELPRLHPCSDDVLEAGMIFNVEPGIYIDGYGGLRDCNMVCVSDTGYELLTPFHPVPGQGAGRIG
jgi:Xaa-Pro aminopeptidase